METETAFNYLFWTVFALVALTFLYRIVKHGGFKGAMFGADIARTVGEVECAKQSMVSSVIKVHVLGGSASERAVGLEIVAKSIGSYQMFPVALSAAEARKLSALLQTATGG